MLLLSQMPLFGDMSVLKDSRIASLGFVEIPLDQRLVFVLDEQRLDRALSVGGVAAVLTSPALADRLRPGRLGLAVAGDPRRVFCDLHNHLATMTGFYGEPQPTRIDPTAVVHSRAHVDATGVVIEARCRIEPNATILSGTTLRRDCRVMPGAVLGSEGFQTMRFADGPRDLVHAGGIEIGERTVIMANAIIARAVFRQATRIGADCRIGNASFVSHNVCIGEGCLIGHGSVVAGNTTIGRETTIGPGAICLDRLTIGERAFVTAGAVVSRSVPDGERVTGNFAIPHARFIEELKTTIGHRIGRSGPN